MIFCSSLIDTVFVENKINVASDSVINQYISHHFMRLHISQCGAPLHPVLQRSMIGEIFDSDTIGHQFAFFLQLLVLGALKLGESPFLGDEDLLASGVLELGSTQGFNDSGSVLVIGSDAHDGLSDVDTGNGSLGFAEGTSHSSLEPISSGTRQHFVDADHMEGVNTHPDVECILTAVLHQVFVGANATGFEGFGRQLLVFIGHQMNTQRKVIYDGPFATQIEDPDLGIGDTSVEP